MHPTDALYEFAQRYLPGGVCASARANAALGHPFYVSRGDGPFVYDLDGREYVDMCLSHGASLLGHNHPRLKAAVQQALELGIICSYETEHHSRLAARLAEMVPCAEMSRFAGSGTETVMHAVRLARAVTGRMKLIKFEGHFHGYADSVYHSSAPRVDQAGPAEAPITIAESAGMPAHERELVIVVPFNDPVALEQAFARHAAESAALILEPVNYDSGCILPEPGFLQTCRALCDRYGVLLVFDEVLTAFRFHPGCAQGYYGVTPDVAVLGKALGGGVPISAICGRREVMLGYRPTGDCEHSGTYLAHLTTVLGALAALDEYSQPGFYPRLNALAERFYAGFRELIARSGVPMQLQTMGPRFGMYFGVTEPVRNYRQAARQDRGMLLAFVRGCIERGVYFHVAAHHGLSAAHTEAELDRALAAIEGALGDVARGAAL